MLNIRVEPSARAGAAKWYGSTKRMKLQATPVTYHRGILLLYYTGYSIPYSVTCCTTQCVVSIEIHRYRQALPLSLLSKVCVFCHL
jgi:hypothetical protein